MRGRTWRVAAILAAILAVNLLPRGAPAQGEPAEYREVHLGVEVRIVLTAEDATAHRVRNEQAARAAFDRIAALESVLSDWRATSEVRRLEVHPRGTWIAVSPALCQVLALALDVARESHGAFDPTVGPLTTLWREAQRTGRPIPDSARASAMTRVGHELVELDTVRHRVRFARDSMRLDLGAIAKGWIIDQALAELKQRRVPAALIAAGGDIALYGAPAGTAGWRINVPRAQGDTVLVLTEGAVSTSGPSEQSLIHADGARESHVIVPRSGRGATDGRAVTVIGASAAITDALATALSLVPPDAAGALALRYGVRIVHMGAR